MKRSDVIPIFCVPPDAGGWPSPWGLARLPGAALALAVALAYVVWPGPIRAAAPAAADAAGVASAPPARTAGQTGRSAEAATAWPESDTVLDLLRADAQAAAAQLRLGRAQDWLAPPTPASLPHTAPPYAAAGGVPDRVDVIAIYGVGRALHADVSINGATWRYRQGRHWPLGVAAGQPAEPGYALVGIDLPCVRLRRDGGVRTACLPTPEHRHD